MLVRHPEFHLGQWLGECERCGFAFRNHQLCKEWTGLRVCRGPGTNDCWDPRHPQDFVQGVRDDQSPPWVAPRNASVIDEALQDAAGNTIYDSGGAPLRDSEFDNEVTPDDL